MRANLQRESVAGILGKIRRRIEHDQRQDHLLEWDLIHRDSVLRKMRGRVDVGAVLADEFVERAAEALLRNRVRLFGFRIAGGRELCLPEA